MYYILTDKWVFEGHKPEDAIKRMLDGERSPFPTRVSNSSDPAEKVLMEGINMCWTYETEKRPSAGAIADYLLKNIKTIDGQVGAIVRAEIPPLPSNHRFTESDFYDSNY
eukprot:CAMPEP_0183316814 /NCGR_PEP_ID=MMETSP0160_2-20130417/56110_1 /TAXON_ID=2839 ORGANISM="Odontella Sinensis, Strain Grunow 1884" /NCGR_SAMPLE_ID=MMETSP0160_2 /ASSEMBLY_ACC=CAM_ASM_000250 /LENGTH=109 /DNA_ID=CAMNT_0025482703 /DNA_START=1 /DNA_END=330 /DNA_ORIENTATION=+